MNVVRQIYYCGVSARSPECCSGTSSVCWTRLGGRIYVLQRFRGRWHRRTAGCIVDFDARRRRTLGLLAADQQHCWITTAGVLAGLTGLLSDDCVRNLARGEWLGRTAGWVALSVLVGLAQTVREPTPYRIGLGAVAGLMVAGHDQRPDL